MVGRGCAAARRDQGGLSVRCDANCEVVGTSVRAQTQTHRRPEFVDAAAAAQATEWNVGKVGPGTCCVTLDARWGFQVWKLGQDR